jgi:hypothetical protein
MEKKNVKNRSSKRVINRRGAICHTLGKLCHQSGSIVNSRRIHSQLSHNKVSSIDVLVCVDLFKPHVKGQMNQHSFDH